MINRKSSFIGLILPIVIALFFINCPTVIDKIGPDISIHVRDFSSLQDSNNIVTYIYVDSVKVEGELIWSFVDTIDSRELKNTSIGLNTVTSDAQVNIKAYYKKGIDSTLVLSQNFIRKTNWRSYSFNIVISESWSKGLNEYFGSYDKKIDLWNNDSAYIEISNWLKP
jgi:hypothetical protein